MANGRESGFTLSRATLALILAIAGPTAAAGIAQYRIGQLEVQRVDQESRLRALETAVTRFEATTDAVEKQTLAIQSLEREVADVSTKLRVTRR